MERNKELETFNFQAFLEKRRNREIEIKGKVDRISNEERMDKMIDQLSKKMDMQKRQWHVLARMYEKFRREDTVEEMNREYTRTIQQTEHTMMELHSFFIGCFCQSINWS